MSSWPSGGDTIEDYANGANETELAFTVDSSDGQRAGRISIIGNADVPRFDDPVPVGR
jgi:hypothetical protein